MKKLLYILQYVIIFVHINTYTAENQLHITYHRAVPGDEKNITHILNKADHNDSKRIVILPERFRENAMLRSINNNKVYVAKNPMAKIVAFKKLFIVHEEPDFDDISKNELRFRGPQKSFVDARIISLHNAEPIVISEELVRTFSFQNSTIIYLGGGYTVPKYRNKKINSQLTRCAFGAIHDEVINSIRTKNSQNLVLVYSLTTANAGEGLHEIDRSPAIIRAFIPFAEKIAKGCNSLHREAISHSRYKALMPTFDPKAITCTPKKSVDCYGNVLLFPLVTEQLAQLQNRNNQETQ